MKSFIIYISLAIVLLNSFKPKERNDLETIKTVVNSDVYTVGDQIHFSNHIFNSLSQKPSFASNIVYVFLVDTEGNVLIQRKYKTAKGVAVGSIEIPISFTSGRYFLISSTIHSIANGQFFPSIEAIEIVSKTNPRFNYKYRVIEDKERDELQLNINVIDRAKTSVENAKITLTYRNKDLRLKRSVEKTDGLGNVVFTIKEPEEQVLTDISFTVEKSGLEERKSIFLHQDHRLHQHDSSSVTRRHEQIWNAENNLTLTSNLQSQYGVKEKIKLEFVVKDATGQPLRTINSIKIIHDVRLKDDKGLYPDLSHQALKIAKSPFSEDILLDLKLKKRNELLPISADTSLLLKSKGNIAMLAVKPPGNLIITPYQLSALHSMDTLAGASNHKHAVVTINDDMDRLASLVQSIDFSNLHFDADPYFMDYGKQITDDLSFASLNILEEVILKNKIDKEETTAVSHSMDYVCTNGILNCSNHIYGKPAIDGAFYLVEIGNQAYKREMYNNPFKPKLDKPLVIQGFDASTLAREVNLPDEYSIHDTRTNLYWNPFIVSDPEGTIKFSFLTSEIKGTYYIDIDGYSLNGSTYSKRFSFEVN